MHSIYKVWIGKDYFGSFVNCMLADYKSDQECDLFAIFLVFSKTDFVIIF